MGTRGVVGVGEVGGLAWFLMRWPATTVGYVMDGEPFSSTRGERDIESVKGERGGDGDEVRASYG